MSNLPILYRNVCDGLATEIGRKAFLWAADTRDRSRFKYAAERYAHEVEVVAGRLWPMLSAARHVSQQHHEAAGRTNLDFSDEMLGDLQRFILKRHANWRFGGNVRMWWEGGH